MDYRETPALPMELWFIIKCCRAAFPSHETGPLRLPSGPFDWERFIGLVRKHRVDGLVWKGIKASGLAIPEAATEELARRAQHTADSGLRAAMVSARLLEHFTRASLPILFVKGLTLGKVAYANPFLKMSWDIDALIPSHRLSEATSLIREMGFRLDHGPKEDDSRSISHWHEHNKDSAWRHQISGVYLELHTRLADHPLLIPSLGINSPLQRVEVLPGLSLPTLADDELFSYLCVHGASSAWFRLKWITDLAALTVNCSQSEISRLYEVSQQLGAGRAAGQALLLLHQLYDIAVSDALLAALKQDRVTRRLEAIALRLLSSKHENSEPTARPFGTLGIHLSQALLMPGWKFGLSELKRQAMAMRAGRQQI